MNNSLSVPEVTELLLLKNDETVRRFIREGKKVDFDFQRIKALESKQPGYYSLCIENENAKPYKITFESVALLLSRRLGKSPEEGEALVAEFQRKKSSANNTSKSSSSAPTSQAAYALAEDSFPSCTITNKSILISKTEVPSMDKAPNKHEVKSYMRFMNHRKDLLAENIMMHNAQIGEVKAQLAMVEHQLIHYRAVLMELENSISKDTQELEETKSAIYKYLEELTI